MANLDPNRENQEDYLKVSKQINKSIVDRVNSFKELGEYSNDILKNWKDIQKTNVKIAQLTRELANADAARAAQIRQEVADLEKQVVQLREMNKSMGSLKNLSKGMFNAMKTNITESFTSFLEFDQKARDAAATIGLGNDRMNMMRTNITNAGVKMQQYGVSLLDAVAAQSSYNDEIGRSVILSEETLINISKIGKATGLGTAAMTTLVGQMEQFGLGANQSANFIYDMYAESSAMGLNAGKVIKKFEQNLGLLNKLNFKNGVNGLKEMAKFSEKYKLDMQAVASVADKVFRPEGAIEAAAQLQVMGGSLAALGDPFTLMYKARNAPEELAKSLTQAAKASATFNSKTGEFEVNAYELDRLRESAQALGMDYQQLVETAKQGAKIEKFEGLLGGKGLDPKDRESIAMMAQMSEKGEAQIQVGWDEKAMRANMKNIKDLSAGEIKKILDNKKSSELAAQQATGLKEQWSNLLNQVMVSLAPAMEKLTEYLKPEVLKGWADRISSFMEKFAMGVKSLVDNPIIKGFVNVLLKAPEWVIGIGLLIKTFGGIAWWYLRGRTLGAGFLATTQAGGGGGIFGRLFGRRNAAPVNQQPQQYGPLPAPQQPVNNPMGPQQQPMVQPGGQPGGQQTLLQQLGNLSYQQLLSIAVGLVAIGVAIMAIGKGIQFASEGLAVLVKSFETLSGGQIVGAVTAIAVVMGGFVGMLGIMIPLVGALGATAGVVSLPLLALGAAFLMIGGGVALAAYGMSILVDSFTRMFDVIGPNGDSVMKAGAGFLMMAAGIGILSYALIGLSASALLGVVGLGVVLGLTTALVTTSESLKSVGGSDGITKAVDAINKVDKDKLDALKDLSMWMALIGATTTIKFDESLDVKGSIEITGQAGGRTNTDWVNDPIFVSKLKQLIETQKVVDKNGGKS